MTGTVEISDTMFKCLLYSLFFKKYIKYEFVS